MADVPEWQPQPKSESKNPAYHGREKREVPKQIMDVLDAKPMLSAAEVITASYLLIRKHPDPYIRRYARAVIPYLPKCVEWKKENQIRNWVLGITSVRVGQRGAVALVRRDVIPLGLHPKGFDMSPVVDARLRRIAEDSSYLKSEPNVHVCSVYVHDTCVDDVVMVMRCASKSISEQDMAEIVTESMGIKKYRLVK